MSKSLTKETLDACRKAWAPPPALTVSEWAAAKRRVAKSSPVPGRWKNETTPYLVDIMDWKNDPDYHTGVFIKASRLGATEAVINMVGYHIDLDPIQMMYAQTSDGEAKKFVKELWRPAVEATPALRDKVSDTKSKSEDASTNQLWKFPGGSFSIVGASSAKPFRMVARPFVIGDDIDGMLEDVDGEGDPIDLLISRAKNFWNKKAFLASTTTIKGHSRIDNWFQVSDKRYFYLPCQNKKCALHKVTKKAGGFRLVWSLLKYKGHEKNPYIECPECGFKHYDGKHKRKMLAGGTWRATATSDGIAGWHLSRMYSPFIPWAEMVSDWIKAQGKPRELKVFVNHALAEPWEEDDVIELDYEYLYRTRREHYPKDEAGAMIVPAGVCAITAGVDVQHDRFEVEYVGWGLQNENWSLGYEVIPADTQQEMEFANKLDPLWDRVFRHESGVNLRIMAISVDSGDGARTNQVYKYCQPRFSRHVFAIKGRPGAGVPLACNPTKQKISGQAHEGYEISVNLYGVGTETAKHDIMASLQINEVGPGYQHFPMVYNESYFQMLCGERAVMRKRSGRMVRVFEVIQGRRNEALDCRVYARAALEICGANLELCKQLIQKEVTTQKNNPQKGGKRRNQRKKNSRTISPGVKL